MDSKKEKYQKALAIIDSILTLTRNYPDLEGNGFGFKLNGSFELLLTALKHTKGYDYIIKVLSYLIAGICYPMEYAVKSIFVAKLTELLSCTIGEMKISEELINNGFTVSLDDIDLMNILMKSPLPNETQSTFHFFNAETKPVNIGQYYYFGCDEKHGIVKADDTIKAQDFNALLWYMKNRATGRVVWYGSKKQPEHDITNQNPVTGSKATKDDGIITLEYSDSGQSLIKADGSPYFAQSPSSRSMRVFIGNVLPSQEGNTRQVEFEQDDMTTSMNDYTTFISDIDKKLAECDKLLSVNDFDESDSPKIKADIDSLLGLKELVLSDTGMSISEMMRNFGSTTLRKGKIWLKGQYFKKGLVGAKLDIGNNIPSVLRSEVTNTLARCGFINNTSNKEYGLVTNNYYYNKPIMKFNIDYIYSVKLFDEKVVTAQLLDALSGCLTMDMSIQASIIKEEVGKIVEKIVKADDIYEVSDCFFTFTNEGYNDLLEKNELYKMGLYPLTSDNIVAKGINPVDVLSKLDELDSEAKSDGTVNIIEDTLINCNKVISAAENGIYDTIDIEENFTTDFRGTGLFENILNGLANAVVRVIISPKLYMMYLINFQLMKQSPTFDLNSFIEKYKGMIVSMTREVVDLIMRSLLDILKEVMTDLVREFGAVLVNEQVNFYKKLIMDCIMCVQMNMNNGSDWTMADVDYADIYAEIERLREPLITQDNEDNNCQNLD